MTWQQFKEAVEKAGVKDEDEIRYIDVSGGDIDDLRLEKSNKGEWEIW